MMREELELTRGHGVNKDEILKYAAKHGEQAAADLLLLIGPDGYTDNDFDDLMQELNA